jgi:uncharacterized protein
MSPKEFLSPDALVRDSFRLARSIYDSGYRPDTLLVLWRGGTPVGIIVHEFLHYKGIRTYHTVVKVESYDGIEKRGEPKIENLDAALPRIEPGSRVLIVDDIFDSGCTVKAVRDQLLPRTRHVAVATLYRKVGQHQTDREPDFVVKDTDRWIVFPHELMDLSPDEIRMKGESVSDLVLGGT